MANTQTAAKNASGLTRGKAILIGVLAIALVGILYWQFGGSSATTAAPPTASAPRHRPPAAPAKQTPAPVVAKKGQTENNQPVAVASIVDAARWASPNLADVVSYDPLALPATFPKPRAIEPIGENGERLVAAAAADDAKKLADAVAELQEQLDELKQRGVHVIVRERDQFVAMIGDRTLHVGDEINGFTVTQIDPNGVRVERKATQ